MWCRTPIESCHVTLLYLSLKSLIKTKRIKEKKKKAHHHTAASSASSNFWKLPLPSFACQNLHHNTHRSSPPYKSPKLCVELVNILEPPWAMIQRFVFHDLPFRQFGFQIINGFFLEPNELFMGFFFFFFGYFGILLGFD